jgi:hypothetical protein
MGGLRDARRLINTAEFDPVAKTVKGRGPNVFEAHVDGWDGLQGYDDGRWHGMWNGRTAAYPVGERGLRRHEIFHGLVDKAVEDPSLNISPTVNALARVRRHLGEEGPLGGAALLAEELAAHAVGGQGPRSLSGLLNVSPRLWDYASQYHKERGLGTAFPAYAAAIATHPAAAAGAVTSGGMLAYGLNDTEEKSPNSLDAVIERLGAMSRRGDYGNR